MADSKVHRYVAKDGIVTWDEGVCAHAAECVRGLPQVFNPRARPWVAPQAATFAELAATIARCPSGALTLLHADGTVAVTAGAQPASTVVGPRTTVKVRADGPNLVSGDFIVAGAPATAKPSVALCRCGASANKPYCDGSHTRVGFRDPGLLPTAALATVLPPGKVTLTPTADGPLECMGPLTIEGADGRTSTSGETWLCRCGQSQTKPFCDGSHSKVDFKG
jgi:CDGSH-type Zn-finger protein/uncharacterized Fe-S cluster protein YjdI